MIENTIAQPLLQLLPDNLIRDLHNNRGPQYFHSIQFNAVQFYLYSAKTIQLYQGAFQSKQTDALGLLTRDYYWIIIIYYI